MANSVGTTWTVKQTIVSSGSFHGLRCASPQIPSIIAPTSTGIDADASKGETSPGYFNSKLVYCYKCGILISARATPFLQHRTVRDGTLSGFPHSGTFFSLRLPWHMMTSSNGNISASLAICAGNSPVTEISMFSLICAWMNGWVNNREAGDLRRHCAHYDVTVMIISYCPSRSIINGKIFWPPHTPSPYSQPGLHLTSKLAILCFSVFLSYSYLFWECSNICNKNDL